MENKQNIPQVGKVTLFKPRVGKVISGQTTSGFSVITPCIDSISKQLIITGGTITNHWYPCYRDHLLRKRHCETTQTMPICQLTKWVDQRETMVCQQV